MLASCSCFALVVAVTTAAPIPAVEEAPINERCPVTDEPIGEQPVTVALWGHTVAFGSESASDSFVALPELEQQGVVFSLLEPINGECPIDGADVAHRGSGALVGGFAVGCCDEVCAAQLRAWAPGQVGAYVRLFVEPINDEVCPQTGDDLVVGDPYYVAHHGRLMQLCCDYCLMEWRYQPAKRDDTLRRALGIEVAKPRIALP